MGGAATSRRILGGAVTLLALLGAIGLASRARTPGSGGPARGLSGDILLEYALLLAAAGAVVFVSVSIYVLVFEHEKAEEDDGPPPRRNWMVALLVSMVAIAIVSAALLAGGVARRHRGQTLTPTGPPAGPTLKVPVRPRPVAFDWVPVIVVGSLVLAGLAAGGVMLVRRRVQAGPGRVQEALALALDEVLGDLRADLDPRPAVIAAYALMERVLARHGLGREPSEAPREYLLRVLPGVGAGGDSVERLTTLYERARFSLHEIDGGMKDEAIAALTFLRNELRGTI